MNGFRRDGDTSPTGIVTDTGSLTFENSPSEGASSSLPIAATTAVTRANSTGVVVLGEAEDSTSSSSSNNNKNNNSNDTDDKDNGDHEDKNNEVHQQMSPVTPQEGSTDFLPSNEEDGDDDKKEMEGSTNGGYFTPEESHPRSSSKRQRSESQSSINTSPEKSVGVELEHSSKHYKGSKRKLDHGEEENGGDNDGDDDGDDDDDGVDDDDDDDDDESAESYNERVLDDEHDESSEESVRQERQELAANYKELASLLAKSGSERISKMLASMKRGKRIHNAFSRVIERHEKIYDQRKQRTQRTYNHQCVMIRKVTIGEVQNIWLQFLKDRAELKELTIKAIAAEIVKLEREYDQPLTLYYRPDPSKTSALNLRIARRIPSKPKVTSLNDHEIEMDLARIKSGVIMPLYDDDVNQSHSGDEVSSELRWVQSKIQASTVQESENMPVDSTNYGIRNNRAASTATKSKGKASPDIKPKQQGFVQYQVLDSVNYSVDNPQQQQRRRTELEQRKLQQRLELQQQRDEEERRNRQHKEQLQQAQSIAQDPHMLARIQALVPERAPKTESYEQKPPQQQQQQQSQQPQQQSQPQQLQSQLPERQQQSLPPQSLQQQQLPQLPQLYQYNQPQLQFNQHLQHSQPLQLPQHPPPNQQQFAYPYYSNGSQVDHRQMNVALPPPLHLNTSHNAPASQPQPFGMGLPSLFSGRPQLPLPPPPTSLSLPPHEQQQQPNPYGYYGQQQDQSQVSQQQQRQQQQQQYVYQYYSQPPQPPSQKQQPSHQQPPPMAPHSGMQLPQPNFRPYGPPSPTPPSQVH